MELIIQTAIHPRSKIKKKFTAYILFLISQLFIARKKYILLESEEKYENI
jgi:hypothetical protein